MSEAATPGRTCMDVAKDLDTLKKALSKADKKLASVQMKINALEEEKRTALMAVDDVVGEMEEKKKEMEELMQWG